MADLSITAANVAAGANANIEHGIFGEAVTQGQPVYREGSTGKYKLADADSPTEEVRQVRGIALNAGAAGQPAAIMLPGADINLGATLAAGTAYYLSATAGGICPVGDLTTGDYFCLLGVAKSTSLLALEIAYTGAAAA